MLKTYTNLTLQTTLFHIFDTKLKKNHLLDTQQKNQKTWLNILLNNIYTTQPTQKNTIIHTTKKKAFIKFIKTFIQNIKTLLTTRNKDHTTTLKIIKIHNKSTIIKPNKILLKFGHFDTTIIYLPQHNTIKATITQNGHLLNLTATNKQTLTHITSTIKNLKKPNSYTGKGIHDLNANIKLKIHKK